MRPHVKLGMIVESQSETELCGIFGDFDGMAKVKAARPRKKKPPAPPKKKKPKPGPGGEHPVDPVDKAIEDGADLLEQVAKAKDPVGRLDQIVQFVVNHVSDLRDGVFIVADWMRDNLGEHPNVDPLGHHIPDVFAAPHHDEPQHKPYTPGQSLDDAYEQLAPGNPQRGPGNPRHDPKTGRFTK